ncbi:hypothetical protein POM88_033107 [Heracleum sosnowskyi]|uniref:Ubiquitin-like protease family profile domain-containing protein n=1 Tax=Heracleum sosnowskyi TaxID=360622 RepID=A0AAD8I0M8_9APIA|nr:hypothetical protein POM88_033107 [Heracleum sosnowskyi]
MDSYDYHSSPKVFDTIEWGLRQMWEGEISDFPDIKKEIVEVPQQPNPFDCSLFVMHMMSLFLHKAPERFQIDNLKMFGKNWFNSRDACALRERVKPIIEEEFNRSHVVSENNNRRRQRQKMDVCKEGPTVESNAAQGEEECVECVPAVESNTAQREVVCAERVAKKFGLFLKRRRLDEHHEGDVVKERGRPTYTEMPTALTRTPQTVDENRNEGND